MAVGILLADAAAAREPVDAANGTCVRDAKVLEWNAIAVDTIGAEPPVPAARFMAITEVAVFEAVNAVTRQYEPYLGTITAPSGASSEAAAIAAAHGVLAGLFPGAAVMLDQKRADSLATIAEGQAKTDGILVGEEAARAMLAERADDGSSPPEFYLPADNSPGDWQLTAGCSAAGGAFLHWQDVMPFGVGCSEQFRADPPFELGSEGYARDFDEVKALGASTSVLRSPDRADVARIYASQSAHIGWNSIARQLATVRDAGITETARTLALLNASITDALITVFESKYHYDFWRPETAIARAADDDNARTAPDPAFTPLVAAPCFPAYPSGHGSVAGAARAILADTYGEGQHELTNSAPGVPGVVLHYTRLGQIVHDISDARVYGGIHFRNDQDAAEKLGSRVARYNLDHLFGATNH